MRFQPFALVGSTGAAIVFGDLVAEAGGVAEAMFIAPWHRDREWSPFLMSGFCGGSASFFAWGVRGGWEGGGKFCRCGVVTGAGLSPWRWLTYYFINFNPSPLPRRSGSGGVDGPRINRWPRRCGACGPSPPLPPVRSSFPWRRYHV